MDNSVFDIAARCGSEYFSRPDGLLDWCRKNIMLRKSGSIAPFDIDEDHDYLLDIYNSPDVPEESFQKAAQKGISIYALLKTLCRMDKHAMKAVYYFPTDDDVVDFSQDRCNPMIDDSPYLSSKLRYDKADNLGLKQLGSSSLYFRGVFSKRKVKSIDADMVVKDEVDEANQENLEFADDRVLHSMFKWLMNLSQPSRPDFGINLKFKQGDMRYRLVQCAGCGHWNNLVENFPQNFAVKYKDGKATGHFLCARCRRRLVSKKKEWVAKHPSRSKDHISWQVSWLDDLRESNMNYIADKYANATLASAKKRFWISIVGVPYSNPDMCPFTDSIIIDNEGKKGFEPTAYSSYIGIDVGDICHVVVLGWTGSKLRLISLAKVAAVNEEEFKAIIKKYNAYFVIDAMPYKTLAKKLCLSYPGWGAIQYFKGNSLHEKTEGEDEYEVNVVMNDRTESIDDLAAFVKDHGVEFPNPRKLKPGEIELYEEFKLHLRNLEKEKQTDKNGYESTVYKKNTANHFGMAFNSAFIAFLVGKGKFCASADPVVG